MKMNEIIVIDEDNDGLEEGEIPDDEVPDVQVMIVPEEKPKELPRRYTLHNKSSNSRHKNCKYKDRNKFKKPSKLEINSRKKHKTSCPRHSSEYHRLKHKEVHNGHNSSAIKSAFKNFTSPPRAPPLPKQVNSNHQNSESDTKVKNFSSACEKAKEHVTQRLEKTKYNGDSSSPKNESISALNDRKKSNNSVNQEVPETPLIDLTEKNTGTESDEEDVEELRRIALATCAKKQLIIKVDEDSSNEITKPSSNEITKPSSNTLPSSPNKVSLHHLVERFHGECGNDSHDNFEVVDMDLDEEMNSCQIINNESLFVIDKMPAVTEFSHNLTNGQLSLSNQNHYSLAEKENQLSNQSQPIDDFEEQLLRAEVIASMSTRQKPQPPTKFPNPVSDKVSEIIAKVDMLHNAVSTLHNEMKPKPCVMYSKGPLQNSVRQPPKRIIDAKSMFPSFKSKQSASPPPPRDVNNIQERLVITLTNDTSTDDSEEETNENVTSQNVPISSIEALISDARQKSDAAQLNNESSAKVSCLSKAQQEEYNSLMRLLAEKSQYSVPAPIIKKKIPTNESKTNLLIKKISVAKANLEKEMLIRTQVEKELLEKKKNYMTSKLKVQMLKEKLHAAEKIRAANLESWKQCSAKHDIVKKSVSKRELLLKFLETELNTKNNSVESNPSELLVSNS